MAGRSFAARGSPARRRAVGGSALAAGTVFAAMFVLGGAARSGDVSSSLAAEQKMELAPKDMAVSGHGLEDDDSSANEAIEELKATKRQIERHGSGPFLEGESMRFTNRTIDELREALRRMEQEFQDHVIEEELRATILRCGVSKECLDAIRDHAVSPDALALQFAKEPDTEVEQVDQRHIFEPPQDKARSAQLRACDASMMFLQKTSDLSSRLWAGEVDKNTYKGNKFIFRHSSGEEDAYSVVALDKLTVQQCTEGTKQLDLFHMCDMAKVGRWSEVDLQKCREEDDAQDSPVYGIFWSWRRKLVANRMWCLVRDWVEEEFGDRWWAVNVGIDGDHLALQLNEERRSAKLCEADRAPCPALEAKDETFRRELLQELSDVRDSVRDCPGVAWPTKDALARKAPPQKGVERLSLKRKGGRR
mmetsp:Transcript_25849/g.73527  ORF Transcript_25849/g.73527 Transcript_25849/m.73527 type:complete len:420 (+) Transcript_25849:99-1358(+)